jgi:hypothetical protein
VCGFVKPGVKEYEIEAEITHEFLRNGSRGHAYTPIIASGYNACVLHYITNDQVCNDGDVILMDFGCEYGGYASDLTRCVPVNGRFTKRQKDVYNAVLRVKNEATQLLRPGTLLADYHKEVGKIMESELIGLGLIDKNDVAKQDPEKAALQEVLHARHQPLPGPRRTRRGPVERDDPAGHGLHRGAGHLHPRGEAGHPPGEQHPGDARQPDRPVRSREDIPSVLPNCVLASTTMLPSGSSRQEAAWSSKGPPKDRDHSWLPCPSVFSTSTSTAFWPKIPW